MKITSLCELPKPLAPILALGLWASFIGSAFGEERPQKTIVLPNRTSANGQEVPAGTQVATYKVWCYDSGKKALGGQPGVLDVVKAIRKRPFSEWVVVYFDAAVTAPNKLLSRLKSHGCKKATQIFAKPLNEDGVKIGVANPICVAGDMVQCTVQFPEGEHGKVRVAPPPEWIPLPLAKAAEDGLLRLDIQSSKTTRAGTLEITIWVTPEGKKERPVKVSVDVVSLVASRK